MQPLDGGSVFMPHERKCLVLASLTTRAVWARGIVCDSAVSIDVGMPRMTTPRKTAKGLLNRPVPK